MSVLGILYWLSRLIAIAAIVHVVMDNRQPAKTIAWALVIYFVPIVGVVAYLFFGVNTRKERQVSRRTMDQLTRRSMLGFVEQRDLQLPVAHKPVIDLFMNENSSLPFGNNKIEVLTDGYQFFPMLLHDIAQAKNHIHIGIYIFEDDALGRLVADALTAKAREGVEVRVIYDDVGCWKVKNRFFEQMRREGIEVEPFMPVRFPSFARRANYRNHRKIFVIDGCVGYIGGMNIALRYVHNSWRDTMLRIEGRGVYSLQRAFLIDWYFVDRTLLSDRKYYPPLTVDHSPLTIDHSPLTIDHSPLTIDHSPFTIDHSPLTIDHSPLTIHHSPLTIDHSPLDVDHSDKYNAQLNVQCSMFNVQCSMFNVQCLLQTVTSGPSSPYPEIMQGYMRIIMAAKRYVYIETPYFLPTMAVLYALKMATQAGVDVRVLIPLRSDARFTEWASRSYLREAMDAGVQIGLYTPGFLHSKLMVCDDSIATCGSTNIDFRSFENNFEANVFIYDEDFASRMRQVFLNDEHQSVSFASVPRLASPGFMARLAESLARLFSPLL
jgi:phosphatidylserine/phosphatidylglycerophosphate/cardiolipin synthase-like enzyme